MSFEIAIDVPQCCCHASLSFFRPFESPRSKKDMGNLLFFTCFHNILQMLPLQLTIGYNFGAATHQFRSPKYVHENETSA